MPEPKKFFILNLFARDFVFSKRQVGVLLVLVSGLGFLSILAIDVFNVGRDGGLGPAQRAALLVTAVLVLIGLSLIPLGDNPA